MPSTAYKGYEVQTTGTNSGTWGSVLNVSGLEIIDRNVGGIVSKSLTSSNVTLTAEESQNLILRLTGTISANILITATSFEGMMIVENLTSGSFTVTFTDGVASVVIPQSARSLVIADSTNGSRIAAGTFPSGTRMLFQQTTPPVGWTKDATHNNKALRLVSGSVSTGGSVDFTTAFASQSVSGTVGDTALTIAQMPAHTHTFELNNGDDASGTEPRKAQSLTSGQGTTNSTGGGEAHTHSFAGTAINIAVQYVDFVIAQKD